jgi:TatD DNase family protein
MLTDTHAHLCYPKLEADLPAVVARARQAGVTRIVSIATDLETSRRTIEIAGEFDGVYAAVGLHPGDVPDVGMSDLGELARLAMAPKVVAIGETGLDYFREARRDMELRRLQKELFRAHLALARERQLPVVIHNREAEQDILEILGEHAAGLPETWRPWGVMHCFAGDASFAQACLEIGLLISFTGILTFKTAGALREVAAQVPLESVMLETDAPFLAPEPYRGKTNEPSYVPAIAAVLAAVKGVSVEEVARVTEANAERLFRFSATPARRDS